MIVNPMVYSGKKLPELDNPGSAADLLAGKQLVDQYGNPLTGTMPERSAGDLSASGAAVTVPAGYYPGQVSKSVAAAEQATPTISVSNIGLITASATQGEGYVAAGTRSATKQLGTNSGGWYMPANGARVVASKGQFLLGDVNIYGDANLVAGNIRSGVSIFGVAGSYAGGSSGMSVLSKGTFYGSGSNVLNFTPTGFSSCYDKMKALLLVNYFNETKAVACGSSRRWILDMLYLFSGQNAVLCILGDIYLVGNDGSVRKSTEMELPDATSRYSTVVWGQSIISITQYNPEGFATSTCGSPYTYYVLG